LELIVSRQEETLTVEDVAAELRVHPDTVRTWIRTGELDAVDIGREYRIYRADLDEFIRRRRTGKKRKKD
jgi:excisionase family DNA binding protein